MSKPYWMPRGRLSEGGIPRSLMHGGSCDNVHDRLLFQKRRAYRRQREEEQAQDCIKLGVKRVLSKEQKVCGARYVG